MRRSLQKRHFSNFNPSYLKSQAGDFLKLTTVWKLSTFGVKRLLRLTLLMFRLAWFTCKWLNGLLKLKPPTVLCDYQTKKKTALFFALGKAPNWRSPFGLLNGHVHCLIDWFGCQFFKKILLSHLCKHMEPVTKLSIKLKLIFLGFGDDWTSPVSAHVFKGIKLPIYFVRRDLSAF